ncbi:MAG TPA: NADH-quinone oxidoreductase subunit J [Elusimicrobiales bacterium]|nr:NADH-quinone oxidoreductase subunit J [Elusimicrobiales bacterium]
MNYHNLLFTLAVLFAAWAVMAPNLLISAMMLALVSVCAALILFAYNAPWAGVFELSVCAGLITVLFIGGVSLVRGDYERNPEGRTAFCVLPLALAIFAIAAWFTVPGFFAGMESWKLQAGPEGPIGTALWDLRRPDLVGQLVMLAAGVFMIKSVFPKKKTAAAEERTNK